MSVIVIVTTIQQNKFINRVSGVQQKRDHVYCLFNDFRLAVYENHRAVRYSAGPVTRRRDFRAARINNGRGQVNYIYTFDVLICETISYRL